MSGETGKSVAERDRADGGNDKHNITAPILKHENTKMGAEYRQKR